MLSEVPLGDSGAADAHGYPRPQMRRKHWESLNGSWEFAIDSEGLAIGPEDIQSSASILVPFAPETPLSGVGAVGLHRACWYRRTLGVPTDLGDHERLILRFGAVDYEATVFLDDSPVCWHEGGYTPFFVDITDHVKGKSEVTIVVRAEDDPFDLTKPRGKQDWQLHPHSIWYPRTSWIWQTVWMERLSDTHIAHLRWTPSLERWEIGLEARIARGRRRAARLSVRLSAGDVILADDVYSVITDEVNRRIALSDPGIDDFRNQLLWTPEVPTLISARLCLMDEAGAMLDEVYSYTALRSVAVQGNNLLLNGRPYRLRMVLDQGYWPDGGMTAPNDAALRQDVELAKRMGFNGVRKHQKLEDPRYLYWADRLGLVVWEEMPSAYRFTHRAIRRVATQWIEAIERDGSHPCIICWVPFNESWGVPNLPDNQAERHYVHSLYYLTKSLDPSRPVVGNDGWESTATDIIGIHDYTADPHRLENRYSSSVLPNALQRERPGGRILVLEGHNAAVPMVLSEFGGITIRRANEPVWGYSLCFSPEDLAHRYAALLAVVGGLETMAGYCYTQFADTYQEANGLLYADRTPKFSMVEMSRATRQHSYDSPTHELIEQTAQQGGIPPNGGPKIGDS